MVFEKELGGLKWGGSIIGIVFGHISESSHWNFLKFHFCNKLYILQKLHVQEKTVSGCIVWTRPLFLRLLFFQHFVVFSPYDAVVLNDLKFGHSMYSHLKIKKKFFYKTIVVLVSSILSINLCFFAFFHLCSKNIQGTRLILHMKL